MSNKDARLYKTVALKVSQKMFQFHSVRALGTQELYACYCIEQHCTQSVEDFGICSEVPQANLFNAIENRK